MSLARINTNIKAMQALVYLQRNNRELAMRQLRLSTGLQINSAEDDAAGYAIARKLESRTRGLSQALSNISDAKSMLIVGEGALDTVMDIVQEMKEKATQAANDSLSKDERLIIQDELENLSKEVNAIILNTDFNGTDLFSTTGDATTLNFQVGANADDNFEVTLDGLSTSYGLTSSAGLDINVSTIAGATGAISDLSDVIDDLSDVLANLGSDQARLSFKYQNVQTAKINYESARSQIEDADFAKEQMQIAKLRILQQTGTAALAQANASPRAILSLLGGRR